MISTSFTALHNNWLAALLLALLAMPVQTQTLTPKQLDEDLQQFQTAMEERWAYLKVGEADYQTPLRALRARARNGLTRDELGLALMRVIALFRDGHAYVTGFQFPAGTLPFLIKPAGGKYVAFKPDRTDFLLPDFPFLLTVDGKTVSYWRNIVRPLAPKGSPQYLTYLTLKDLHRIQFIRQMAGLPQRDEVSLRLASVDGKRTTLLTLNVSGQTVTEERWPITTSRLLPDNIGYLRIPVMNAAAVETIRQWMPQFKTTKGLIVDIRDNGGGSRAALRELFPYVMNSAAAPHVANASKYPLFREFTPGQLEDRFMYREDWQGWTPEERNSIAQFKRSFQPDWQPPVQEFSDWHYLVLARHNNAAAYHYDRPVVILMNEDCFSASDIFLSAFKGWPGVTLIGMPSAGGSSRVVAITLKNSGLKVGLGSMVSFQRNGRLYDGNGVQPDILVAPSPVYFLKGGTDNVLLRATQFIQQTSRKR